MKRFLQSMDTTVYVKFWTVVFAFLITIFPNSSTIMLGHHITQNSVTNNAPVIAEAFKEKDADPLLARLCANIKRNDPDAQEHLRNMFDLIQGDVQTAEWELCSGPVSADQDKICQAKLAIHILADRPYQADICWEILNEDHMEEAGIKAIILSDVARGADQPVRLFELKATEGVYALDAEPTP